MISEIRDSEFGASKLYLANTSKGNPTSNPNLTNNRVAFFVALPVFLNTVMQGIKESKEQTAALHKDSRKQTAAHEESRKQTAALQQEFKKQTATQEESRKQTAEESRKQTTMFSAKLTSAVESVNSKIEEENRKLADSLTAQFEAAHHKIREDFDAKLNSEIITVSAKIDNVQKSNESEIINYRLL
jgi:septal ring factor EnvC (AmiA/AmiB activator)